MKHSNSQNKKVDFNFCFAFCLLYQPDFALVIQKTLGKKAQYVHCFGFVTLVVSGSMDLCKKKIVNLRNYDI